MNKEEFEKKTNELLMACCDIETTAEFKEKIQEVIGQVERDEQTGCDAVLVAGRIGYVKGLLAVQDAWLIKKLGNAIFDQQCQQQAMNDRVFQ